MILYLTSGMVLVAGSPGTSHPCKMCCHKLYIYSSCGHSTFGPKPLIECCNAAFPPDGSFSTLCKFTAHPFQSWKINALCPECHHRRTVLMDRIEISQAVKYDEWRWKVSYGMPAHGKDFWGRKADERAELEAKTGKRTRKALRFSWRRSKHNKDAAKVAGGA